MSQPLKPIKLYGGVLGPNPAKTAIILEELNIPYESVYIPLDELKTPIYESINPNGRLPAIEDPNTGLTIWESGAIVQYLVETYDKGHKLSFPAGTAEAYHTLQWLFFQVSGQGPYYGQAGWFSMYHPEKLPSAIDRYFNEARRVSRVLDRWLEEHEWLVGDKCTYADLAFVPWQTAIEGLFKEAYDPAKEFPHVAAWLERMKSRETVSRVLAESAERRAALQQKS
ncbi:hypothetical protein VTN00DRAFT_3221 [Thermoascus crustaceus]|uniref:uncharacterized protein n=1 Tax=Thermoascus crustaceus TaxID=5088 RepID=UPI003743EB58